MLFLRETGRRSIVPLPALPRRTPPMSHSRYLCVLGVLLASASAVARQGPTPPVPANPPVFHTSADLVTIDAVVTDENGNPVTDLSREDFEVRVAGKRQALDQAVDIRTRDQPRILAAARAASAASASGAPEHAPPSEA